MDTEGKELAKKVKSRQKFLMKVVNFVENLLVESGVVVSEYIGSSHTNVIRQLIGLKFFSFRNDSGQTMMGGNTVTIWFHSGLERIDLNSRLCPVPVLDVYFQVSMDDCNVRSYDERIDWVTPLKYLMRNKKRIIAKMKKENAKAVKNCEGDMRSKRELAELKKKADKLKIAI